MTTRDHDGTRRALHLLQYAWAWVGWSLKAIHDKLCPPLTEDQDQVVDARRAVEDALEDLCNAEACETEAEFNALLNDAVDSLMLALRGIADLRKGKF
jgi:hypothetical protein